MSNCCGHINDGERLFSRFARLSCCCYNLKGLSKSQQMISDTLIKTGVEGKTVLDIGCGVGYLHQSLLQAGAGSAIGVDLASKMLEQARALSTKNSFSDTTRYLQGDFVQLAETIEPADIMLLDKVVCCYPDAQSLTETAIAKTGQWLALTYPRDRAFIHALVWLEAFFLRLIGSGFRSYVHKPEDIESMIKEAGFNKRVEQLDAGWITQVWERE